MAGSKFDVGTGFVSIVLSAKGIKSQVDDELGKPIADSVSEHGDKAATGFFDNFGSKGKALAGVLGVSIGGALIGGVVESMGRDTSNDLLSAQLGATPEEAKRYGKISGKVYGDNFGENVGDINNALKGILQNGLLPRDAANADLESITKKALTLSQVLGTDVGETSRAVGQMLKTGMAGSAEEAFDIIARASQNGANASGDLLDTLNEYPVQFEKLGLDGPTAMGLLQQAMLNGARDTDVAADALKEFSIRGIDGSKLTGESFAALGLNGEEMAAKLTAGGDTAAGALDQTLDALRGVEDPVERARIATGLFGTQAEDLGDALFSLDPSEATTQLGDFSGSVDTMAATIGSNTSSKIESLKRKFENLTSGVAGAVGPILGFAPAMGGLVTTFGGIPFGKVAEGAGKLATNLGSILTKLNPLKIATAIYTGVQSALNIVMSLNPIGLVVIAIGALVAAFILAYQNIEPFRDLVDAVANVLKNVLGTAIDFVKEYWLLLLGPIGVVIKYFDEIKAAIGAVADFMKEALGKIVDFFKALPGNIIDAIGDLAGLLLDKGKAIIGGFINGYVNMYVEVGKWFAGLGGKIVDAVGDLASILYEKGKTIISGLASGAKWFMDFSFGVVRGIPGRIVDAVGDLGNTLYQAGKDLMQGLIDGVKYVAGWLTDAVLSPVKNAVGAVKGFLGINSPSKLFMEIGGFVTEGFVLGIASGGNDVQKAMNDLAAYRPTTLDFATLVPTGDLGLAPGGLGGPAPGKVVTNNINVHAQTNADPNEIARAMQFGLMTSGAI